MNIDKIYITSHAIEKFKMRAQLNKVNDFDAKNKILSLLSIAKKEKKISSAIQIMNNNYIDAEYYSHGKFIFVIIDNRLVTMYRK